MIPALVDRRSNFDIEAPVFYSRGGKGPCYVPDRDGNTEHVDARDTDYEFS